MKCKYCGQELLEEANFCSNCGAKKEETKEQEEIQDIEVINESQANQQKTEQGQQPLKCWSIFAKVSKILGIVSLCICWIPIFGLFGILPGIPGIVFGILGKKANNDVANANAKKGFVMSLIGTIVALTFYILIFIVLFVLEVIASAF